MSLDLRDRVRAVRWFHSIDLGNGLVTPGADASAQRLARMALPRDLGGLRVLDIGAWDGFFSFEAERRGAASVLATDSWAWDGQGWSDKSGFDLAHEVLGSKVQSLLIDVLDLSPETVGADWDVVLCLGVLYHMKHPMLALERVASVTGRLLILETECDDMLLPWPSLAFYPAYEFAGDSSNWFGPNAVAVEGMLRAVGFTQVKRVWQSSFTRRLARAFKMRARDEGTFLRGLWRDRMTFHAVK
jgi:tRNA (mo5U34)-methyltransferase